MQQQEVRAVCPECGKEGLHNVYERIVMYVPLRKDGTVRDDRVEYEGGEFSETYCPECNWSTTERTFHEIEVEVY